MQSVVRPVSSQSIAIDQSPDRYSIILLGLALAALWFVCCRALSAEWSFNEQYNYGWFVPLFAAYLFWLRWIDRPEPGQPARKFVAAILLVGAALVMLPLRVFEIGSADWRPLDWLHAVAAVTITLSIVYLTGGRPWLRHFSFPVLFFFVAVPWITAIEEPIVQGFMRIVAASAAETLALCGIPVEVEGNLMRLPNGVVGVNEACSGVRSLQTSVMIGLLFGELKRLRLLPRFALVASAVTIALIANFLRASLLVWIASSRGLAALTRWHDFAGYAVVLLVFAGTMWMASLWKTTRPSTDAPSSPGKNSATPLRPFLFAALLVWLVAVEAGAEFWYRMHERNLVTRPSWSVLWPDKAPGYRELPIDTEVRNMLRFNSGREVIWSADDGAGSPRSSFNYLFFFRWNPGSGTILRARAHRPDICLPAAGWTQVGADQVQQYRVAENQSLAFRRFNFVKHNGSARPLRATAFFILHEDAANETERGADGDAGFYSNWDWADRWRVVRNGIRNRGQQVFELIMITPPQVDDAVVDQRFAEILPGLISTRP